MTPRPIEHEAIEELIASIDAALAPVSVGAMAGGDNSDVFSVRAADGARFVVKLYSDELAWKMRKEILAYDLLEPVAPELPLARIVAADDSKALIGRNYLVMTMLPGRLLFSLLDDLTDEEVETIDRQIGAALATMHRVELDAFGYLGPDGVQQPFVTNRAYMTFQFDKKLAEFDRLDGERAVARAMRRFIDDRVGLLDECTTAVFCHDDCHEGNVLVDDALRVTGIIDFENVVAGDPLLDIAKTETYRRRRSERRLAALMEGYGTTPRAWPETLELYSLYHRLELWDWFASHGRQEPLAGLVEDMRAMCAAG